MESRMFYIMGKIEGKTTLEELSRIDANLRRYGVDTCDEYGYYMGLNGEIEIRNLLYEQLDAIYRQVFWNLRIKVTEIGEQEFNEETEEVEDIVIYHESFKPVRLTEPWTFVEHYMDNLDPIECENDSEENEDEDEESEDDEDEE